MDIDNEKANGLYKLARHMCNKYVVAYDEELVQELVCHACSKLHNFDENRGKFSTYVCNVMFNHIRTLYRRQNTYKRNKGRANYSIDYIVDEDKGKRSFSEFVDSGIDLEKLMQQKEIIEFITPFIGEHLRLKIEGYSAKEIAKICGCSEINVRYVIKRNIHKIKKLCEEKGIECDL